jgi:multidrug efflux pump subunit AcrA (membrane-fusion protein)
MVPNDSHMSSKKRAKFYLSSILDWFKRNFWGIATITIVTIICLIIVHVFKKPGQMTVIESQAMDMSAMIPPKGAVPVGIARAEYREIEGSVIYTGTVQSYEDEDVYPRVTGQIVKMPVYPGDRVNKGQLLVQLDPSAESEYKARREEAQFAYDSAMHNAGIAKAEFAQKDYELKAATEAEAAAKQEIAEAQASLNYWKPETERQRKLYEKQVVSLAEYQQEESFCKAAMAKTEAAKAKLRQATNTKLAAQAALDAMIHHIGHFYDQAKQAKAAEVNAAIYEKYTKIIAKDDGVVIKRIISPGVVVNPGMLILKLAHIKQVRVQAELASDDIGKIRLGDIVFISGSPGSTEQIKANVTSIFPAADPTSRTSTVEALIDNVIHTPIISVSPDQIKTVNQYRFLPGQYVVMKIVIGEKSGLVIPTSALLWREDKTQVWKAISSGDTAQARRYTCIMHPEVISDKPGKCPKCGMELVPKTSGTATSADTKQYTCTMHPEVISDKPGKCPKCGMELVPKVRSGNKIAQLQTVKVGLANVDETEIVSGLSEGDEVISAGYERLQAGMPIVSVEWSESGPEKLPLVSEIQANRLDASNGWVFEQMIEGLMMNASLQPVKSNSNNLVIKLSQHGGGTVSGAVITGRTSMPGMNMPGPDLSGVTGNDGIVRLKSNLSSGLWEIRLSIKASGQKTVEGTIDVEVP